MSASTGRSSILVFPVAPYDRLEREWRWAEEVGFDAVWVPDTFTLSGLNGFETWPLLAAIARTTARVRLGSLISTVMPRHPSLLAIDALTVDHISNGRVEVGVGTGDTPEDWDVFGLSRWPPKERVDRLEEHLSILDALLRGERHERRGTHYSVSAFQPVAPVQRPRPPILVAAEGPRALSLAARYADGWVTLAGQPPKDWAGGRGGALTQAEAVAATRERLGRLRALAAEAGRDAGAIRVIALAYRQDPLRSLDAFDDFVGSLGEVGVGEFVFYWPPPSDLSRGEPVASERRLEVERIAASRFSPAVPG